MSPCRIRLAIAAPAAVAALLSGTPVHAGNLDLNLLNLCPLAVQNGGLECTWIRRDAQGFITNDVNTVVRSNDPTAIEARSNFRSLMSELGVAMAPRLLTPADTLGISGFQVSAEVGTTQISSGEAYWNAARSVSAENPRIGRPGGWVTTAGAYVRKGLWLPVPSFEIGGGAVNLLGSNMWALQGYLKIALQEGFHGWPVPSLAVRGSLSHLVGSDQVDLDVYGVDASISKAFSLAGTARIEPFGGWNLLLIKARSRTIDATPRCDAYRANEADAGTTLQGSGCYAAQSHTLNDLQANFRFPDQDLILRSRFFAGFKIRLAMLFLAAQYELTSAGKSRDSSQANGAVDRSGRQQAVTGSAGFDF